jgi:hypothetical protein
VDLPPPPVIVRLAFFPETVLAAAPSAVGSFSARAPPALD